MNKKLLQDTDAVYHFVESNFDAISCTLLYILPQNRAASYGV